MNATTSSRADARTLGSVSERVAARGLLLRPGRAAPHHGHRSGHAESLIHVSKQFGAVPALEDCSFSVERGRMLGFLGPNGAGKTTAMRTIFGLGRT